MQFAILKILSGHAAGRKAVIRPGQVLRVGRAFDADFSIPEDSELGQQHFVFDATQNGCQIRCYPECKLVFGEESATERAVYNGDQFRAGGTEFVINIEGELAGASRVAPQAADEAIKERAPAAPPPACDLAALKAAEVIARYQPDDVVPAMLKPEMSCLDLLSALAGKQEYDSAVRLLCFALPKQHAVWWAIGCVEQSAGDKLTAQDKAALESARNWVIDPSEENRRLAEAGAAPIQMGSAAGAAALGAFWSGGSLAPAEFDAVPPPNELTAQAVYAAMCLTCIEGDGRNANLPRFYETGLKIAAGENLWG